MWAILPWLYRVIYLKCVYQHYKIIHDINCTWVSGAYVFT